MNTVPGASYLIKILSVRIENNVLRAEPPPWGCLSRWYPGVNADVPKDNWPFFVPRETRHMRRTEEDTKESSFTNPSYQEEDTKQQPHKPQPPGRRHEAAASQTPATRKKTRSRSLTNPSHQEKDMKQQPHKPQPPGKEHEAAASQTPATRKRTRSSSLTKQQARNKEGVGVKLNRMWQCSCGFPPRGGSLRQDFIGPESQAQSSCNPRLFNSTMWIMTHDLVSAIGGEQHVLAVAMDVCLDHTEHPINDLMAGKGSFQCME
ncbi:hypothetical protein EYF80_042061 [Liparis tanakae]|uniref:Uncharacterized protein n=1 Tax=Liparis tanakae TaxID=230148 RepID=A0A4Z2G577_9TELE|nr:hypothetical protein EYF80_042061 [Liparis tanakae]